MCVCIRVLLFEYVYLIYLYMSYVCGYVYNCISAYSGIIAICIFVHNSFRYIFRLRVMCVCVCMPLASLEVLSHSFSSRRPLGTSINPLLFMDLGRYFHAPTGRSSFSPFYLFFLRRREK